MTYILLITLYYYPEPISHPHELAKTLTNSGLQVKVITSYPNYPNGQIYDSYKHRNRIEENVEKVNIFRVSHFIDRTKSSVKRIMSFISFSASVILYCSKRMEKPDIIWTYQVGLPGLILSKLWEIPYIHEVQDLWPDWGVSARIGIKSFLNKILETQEKIIYNHAAAIVTITPGFKKILSSRVKNPEKIVVIPNWANDNFLVETTRPTDDLSKEISSDFFNVLYVGNIGTAQGLIYLVQAAFNLKDHSDIQITIIGDGVEKIVLEDRTIQLGLPNIKFLGSLPQEIAAQYMKIADVLFIHLKDDPVYEITIPSKTYGYLAAKRPILAAARGELANLINENKVGLVCPPEDSQAIANAIIKLKNLPREELDKMGLAGYNLVTNNFTREILGKKYVDLFEEILEKRKGKKI